MQIALGIAAAGVLLLPVRPLRTALDWPVLAFVGIAIASDLLSPYGAPALAETTLWRSVIGFFVVAHGLRLLPHEAPLRLLYWGCARRPLSSRRLARPTDSARWASSPRASRTATMRPCWWPSSPACSRLEPSLPGGSGSWPRPPRWGSPESRPRSTAPRTSLSARPR